MSFTEQQIAQLLDQLIMSEDAKEWEEFIAENFNRIDFGRRLTLYQDEEHTGRQYPTAIGPIDLLAQDEDTGDFVVIELKKGRSSDGVLGQLLRYMGWVEENLCQKEQSVEGVIISREDDIRLRYALRIVSNVALYLYEVSFQLNRAF